MRSRLLRRRVIFGAVVGAFALALGPPLFAQPGRTVRRIGMLFLDSAAPEEVAITIARLAELGWVENRTLSIERAYANGERARLPELARTLVRNGAEVISVEDFDGALAAAQATTRVPIVMVGVTSPVERGLIESYARPGRNITGVAGSIGADVAIKRLALLKEVVPQSHRLAWVTPTSTSRNAKGSLDNSVIEVNARRVGFEPVIYPVEYGANLDKIFAEILGHHTEVLSVGNSGFLRQHRDRIIDFANTHRLPSAYADPSYVDAGGLLSYVADIGPIARTSGEYIDRLLRGADPATMPVEQPTRFATVINLRTAKLLGLVMPQSVLVRADRVIE